MTQGTTLTVKETFAFKVNNKGKVITFRKGQLFWVTNTQINQTNTGIVNVARNNQTIGYDFTSEQVAELFSL